MKRRHLMPFGATIEPGGVRFRLWAPDAGAVELCLDGPLGERVHRMRGDGDGWFDCLCEEAHAGSRYTFRIDGGIKVPDPASRHQPDDVHAASAVVDPCAFDWKDEGWRGRPWHEAVIYELHVGTFTRSGDFAGVEARLDYLKGLGITAVELMPVADFPGARGWGYDGVLLFAPESAYGRPEDLKRLVQAAHERGLMVLLDVVYNHFGPDGNYLHAYAGKFFTDRHHTPWGKANNFDDDGSRVVRDFFIHNALYWLEEYHLDGLRLDAVHAIIDDSETHFLTELAETVRREISDRHVHLVLENDDNAAHFLARGDDGSVPLYTAQWNDDLHHVMHVIATGEEGGYYRDYAKEPLRWLARCLDSGFAYQGEPSPHRDGARRGEPSGDLPPFAFVSFLQNHDQVGNRALGERINKIAPRESLRALQALMLLAPFPPLLFMGEERLSAQPFYYFCDFHDELAQAVREGRRAEFKSFPEFGAPEARERIPDPNAESTFAACVLDWPALDREPHHGWRDFIHDLLYLRKREIVPRLPGIGRAKVSLHGAQRLSAEWPFADGTRLVLHANLGPEPADAVGPAPGRLIYGTHGAPDALPAWCVTWYLARKETR